MWAVGVHRVGRSSGGPVVGYIWGWVNNHDRAGARCAGRVLAFDIATLIWVAVFSARFVVQHHLYDADQTGWLGVARIAMGWPLTAVAALVTYLAIKAAQRAVHEHHGNDATEDTAEDTADPAAGTTDAQR